MPEWEGDQISDCIKAALATAKARGVQLGRAGTAKLRSNTEVRQATADAHAAKLAGVIAGTQSRGLAQ